MKPQDVRRVAVIGSGTMGAGIGLCFAHGGREVILYDPNPEQIDRALTRLAQSQALLIQEGVISAPEAEAARGRVERSIDLTQSVAEADFIIEAAPEVLDLKAQLFKEMAEASAAEAILTTNTSGLSVTAIAAACRHPERVAGMHWFNPAELTPLVEVIRGERTSDQTMDLICEVAKELGKVPVKIQKELSGFASNRLQMALLREALALVAAGVMTVEDVDEALKNGIGFRHAWLGPFETADLGGLDVFHRVSEYLFKDLATDVGPPAFFSRLVEEGKLGLKTGQGFHTYDPHARAEIIRRRDLFFIRQMKLLKEMEKS